MPDKNSANRDTRPLKGCDLTQKCSLWGIQKDHLIFFLWGDGGFFWAAVVKIAFNCTNARSENEQRLFLSFFKFETYDSYENNSYNKMCTCKTNEDFVLLGIRDTFQWFV